MQTWAWASFILSWVTSGDRSVCQAVSHLLNNLSRETLHLSQMPGSTLSSCWEKEKLNFCFFVSSKNHENKVNMQEGFPNGWVLGVWSGEGRETWSDVFAGLFRGRKAVGFALAPDNDRLAGCFLHCSRQAINLSAPASLEIPALRLRMRKKRVLNSQECCFLNTSVNV